MVDDLEALEQRGHLLALVLRQIQAADDRCDRFQDIDHRIPPLTIVGARLDGHRQELIEVHTGLLGLESIFVDQSVGTLLVYRTLEQALQLFHCIHP